MDWIRKNQPLGWKMRFYDTQVHFLSPEGAYTVSLGEEEIEGEREPSHVGLPEERRGVADHPRSLLPRVGMVCDE